MSKPLLALLLASLTVLGFGGAAGAAASTASWEHAADGDTGGAAPASIQASSSRLEGIDVSHWNGSIDWQKVAGDGKRFAIMKATDGRSYVDPTYSDNRQGAIAAGLVVTAYHFARPDNTKNDGRKEADHFVDVAGVGVGDIVPVLDLERTGGLSQKNLVAWVWDWVKEVHRLTRVKPMIYSGYYGWIDRTGNTEEFADAGYRLWLANWCNPSTSSPCPRIPANGWGGHGWTFWQYTDCGHVAGMSGCVDLDRFKSTNMAPVRIPLLSVITNGFGSVASSPRGIACEPDCSSVFNPGSTVTLTATPAAGAVLVAWKGLCSGTTTCQVKALGSRTVRAVFGYTLTVAHAGLGTGSVTSSAPDDRIACGTAGTVCSSSYAAGVGVTLAAVPDTGSQFDGWTGACTGWDLTCSVTMDQARSVTATFADDTPPTPTIRTPMRLDGGAVAIFDEPVHGVAPSDFLMRQAGRDAGVPATLRCADQRRRPVRCSTGDVARAFLQPNEPLVPGQHYEVVVDPAGAPSQIVDRAGNPAAEKMEPFRAATNLEESTAPDGWSWDEVHDRLASGRSYSRSDDPGAFARLAFRGRVVTWHTFSGPGRGTAQVLIDGHSKGVFDLAGSVERRAEHRFGRLGAGPHTIRVVVVRGRREGVPVDGFEVVGSRVPDADVSYRWGVRRAGAASGDAFAWSDDAGSSLRFQFRGTAIRWITVRGPDQGRAAVYVDGSLHATYDGYAPSRTFGSSHTIRGLTDALHWIRIVVLGTSRRVATDTAVAVDALLIS